MMWLRRGTPQRGRPGPNGDVIRVRTGRGRAGPAHSGKAVSWRAADGRCADDGRNSRGYPAGRSRYHFWGRAVHRVSGVVCVRPAVGSRSAGPRTRGRCLARRTVARHRAAHRAHSWRPRRGLHVGGGWEGHGGARGERGAGCWAPDMHGRRLHGTTPASARRHARRTGGRSGGARKRSLMTPDVHIRPAVPQDVDAIVRLNNRFADEMLMLRRTPDMVALAIDDFVVAVNGSGIIVGCGALKEYSPSVAEVAAIAVAREAHGQGVG